MTNFFRRLINIHSEPPNPADDSTMIIQLAARDIPMFREIYPVSDVTFESITDSAFEVRVYSKPQIYRAMLKLARGACIDHLSITIQHNGNKFYTLITNRNTDYIKNKLMTEMMYMKSAHYSYSYDDARYMVLKNGKVYYTVQESKS